MSGLLEKVKKPVWNFLGLHGLTEEDKRKLINRRTRHYGKDTSIVENRGFDTVDAPMGERRRTRRKDPAHVAIWRAATSTMGKKKKRRPAFGRSFTPGSVKKEHKTKLPDWMKAERFFDDLTEDEVRSRAEVEGIKGFDTVDAPMGRRSRMDRGVDMKDIEMTEPLDFKPGSRGIDTLEGPILQELEERCCDFISCDCKRACRPDSEFDLDNDDKRPFFTYFISFVQTVIMICALAVYGFAPLGVDEISEQELIVKPSLVIELEKRSEFGNFWLGPSQQNLIHLGAKYSPCMRKDPNLEAVLKLDRDEERMTGCCVRDDGSGCVQTIQRKCSGLLSTFVRWNDTSNIRGGYKSGAVCGTDPRYCKKPASTKPFEWDKNDFTNWPICEDTNKPGTLQSDCSSSDCHMTCDLLGRPCCHGIQGECMITTREHCDFKKGYFHDDKFLCSQVNCFEEICGMIPFVDDGRPDQFSRVLSANLLHAGVFHLAVSLLFQLIIMRMAEKEIGWVRMALIYLGSGTVGTLASSVLLPYQVEVGPSGAQFGVLACMYVDILNVIINRKVNNDHADNSRLWNVFILYSVILLILFVLGLLPWLDNWAHIFGFISGVFISLVVMKDVSVESKGLTRWVVVLVSLIIFLLIFVLLLICFYVVPVTEGSWIQYINCIPITETFCKNMDVAISRGATYTKYT